jgi:hypothetical protein
MAMQGGQWVLRVVRRGPRRADALQPAADAHLAMQILLPSHFEVGRPIDVGPKFAENFTPGQPPTQDSRLNPMMTGRLG